MHIYFSGIGGAGIGPLAMVAHRAGYTVSGSDLQNSSYIDYLKKQGLKNITVGQNRQNISTVHQKQAIDWFVYSSALEMGKQSHPEVVFCRELGIKTSKRDDFINYFLNQKKLKLIAIAGTHGKTTTTAMVIWLLKQLGLPISYLLPAKTSFAELGDYLKASRYFIYEADEFDRNFLAFKPHLSLISGVSYDHHEIYKSREEYKEAFLQFINQSEKSLIWQNDLDYLKPDLTNPAIISLNEQKAPLNQIKLLGLYNRKDGWLAVKALNQLISASQEQLINLLNDFPGLSRRMEKITLNLYSDYAHTPEKIRGALSVASEMAKLSKQKLIVLYEPLTNRRQHYIIDDYKDCFNGADQLYWLPSYLAREDDNMPIISPEELIAHLSNPSIAKAANKGPALKDIIKRHLSQNDLVVCLAGGGGGCLDDWLRENFKT